MRPWTCLGEGAPHPADTEEVERTWDNGSTVVAIHRCDTCGQLYRWHHFEVNDWSAGSDYCDETWVWTILAADEVEAVRADPNFVPRGDRTHREDSGWRREG